MWEKAWWHLHTGGRPHPAVFVEASAERRTAEVAATRDGAPSIRSGLDNLAILKTAGSEFAGFIKDSWTTLPEASDRLLGTSVCAQWKYSSPGVPFVPL